VRLADLQLNSHEGAVIARLSGEIDMSNAAELRAAIADYTANSSAGVVLDLSSVHYVDSSGIHMLYRLSEGLRERGLALRIVIPPESPASDALRLAGIGAHAEAVGGVDEGLRELATSAASDL
jgi:anti-sigma B factor antagonist